MVLERSIDLSLFALLLMFVGGAAYAIEEPVLVDPTRPLAFVAPVGKPRQEEIKLNLQAVYLGGDRREAVINGHRVKVGDFVDQAKILAIKPGRVSFLKNGERGELVLLPTVLQPARVEE